MIQKVSKPSRDHAADFDSVIVRRRRDARALLHEIRDRVVDAYSRYEEGSGSPVDIDPLKPSVEVAKALKGNYLHTYAGAVLGQLRIDALAAVEDELCPMCGVGFVSDLDHYLPKEKFPEFSVLALNLVPVCSRCNGKKRSVAGDREGRFFHAYYDDVPESPSLLVADLEVAQKSVIVSFDINHTLPMTIYKDARYHFKRLRLSDAYVTPAVNDLVGRIHYFEELYEIGGPDAVAYGANRIALNHRREFGSQFWKAVLYDAVAASHQFCDGGFNFLSNRKQRSQH